MRCLGRGIWQDRGFGLGPFLRLCIVGVIASRVVWDEKGTLKESCGIASLKGLDQTNSDEYTSEQLGGCSDDMALTNKNTLPGGWCHGNRPSCPLGFHIKTL